MVNFKNRFRSSKQSGWGVDWDNFKHNNDYVLTKTIPVGPDPSKSSPVGSYFEADI